MSATNSTSASANASANSPSLGSLTVSFLMTFLGPIGVIVLGIVSLILFIVPTVRTITFTDDNPNMQAMRPQVTKIVGSTLLAMGALLFVSMLYFLQDERKAMSTVFVLICLTLGLSFSALAMSTLS